jgi:hypothetical protein
VEEHSIYFNEGMQVDATSTKIVPGDLEPCFLVRIVCSIDSQQSSESMWHLNPQGLIHRALLIVKIEFLECVIRGCFHQTVFE